MGIQKDFDREELERLIEEKILELAGDPDNESVLRGEIRELLEERKEEPGEISHEEIIKEFG